MLVKLQPLAESPMNLEIVLPDSLFSSYLLKLPVIPPFCNSCLTAPFTNEFSNILCMSPVIFYI
jgi:hypothetical protein